METTTTIRRPVQLIHGRAESTGFPNTVSRTTSGLILSASTFTVLASGLMDAVPILLMTLSTPLNMTPRAPTALGTAHLSTTTPPLFSVPSGSIVLIPDVPC